MFAVLIPLPPRPLTGYSEALTLRDGDELNNVLTTDGKQNILIGTHLGYAVTFNEKDVRSMGRTAAGVRGINLRDNVIGFL